MNCYDKVPHPLLWPILDGYYSAYFDILAFPTFHVTDNDFTDNDNFLIRNLFDNNQHISSRLLKKLDLNVR